MPKPPYVEGVSRDAHCFYSDPTELEYRNRTQKEFKGLSMSQIRDIVKKKKITFLKSASLFSEEEDIFGLKNSRVDMSSDKKEGNHLYASTESKKPTKLV